MRPCSRCLSLNDLIGCIASLLVTDGMNHGCGSVEYLTKRIATGRLPVAENTSDNVWLAALNVVSRTAPTAGEVNRPTFTSATARDPTCPNFVRYSTVVASPPKTDMIPLGTTIALGLVIDRMNRVSRPERANDGSLD